MARVWLVEEILHGTRVNHECVAADRSWEAEDHYMTFVGRLQGCNCPSCEGPRLRVTEITLANSAKWDAERMINGDYLTVADALVDEVRGEAIQAELDATMPSLFAEAAYA